MAIELNASSDYGQSGQYIARITGRAPRVQFAREFVGRKWGKRNEGTTATVDEPGLYEVQDCTRKGKRRNHCLVVEFEAELHRLKTDESDALQIAKRLDGGEAFGQIIEVSREAVDPELLAKYPNQPATRLVYSIRTPGEAKRAVAAATVDSAVEAIVAALGALPVPLQKQALSDAKARLFPKATASEGITL